MLRIVFEEWSDLVCRGPLFAQMDESIQGKQRTKCYSVSGQHDEKRFLPLIISYYLKWCLGDVVASVGMTGRNGNFKNRLRDWDFTNIMFQLTAASVPSIGLGSVVKSHSTDSLQSDWHKIRYLLDEGWKLNRCAMSVTVLIDGLTTMSRRHPL